MKISQLKKILEQSNVIIENGHEYYITLLDHANEKVHMDDTSGHSWDVGYRHIVNNIDDYEFKYVDSIPKYNVPEVDDRPIIDYELQLESGEPIGTFNIGMNGVNIDIRKGIAITPENDYKIMLIKGRTLKVKEIK